MYVELFFGWVLNVLICIAKLLSFSLYCPQYHKTKHAGGSSLFPFMNLQEKPLLVEPRALSAATHSVQHGFSLLAQKQRDSASKRAKELQGQLNELCKKNESLRKARTLDLQTKVCYLYAADVCTFWWLDSKWK